MKVGIITWHHYPNVGSALQAFALTRFLQKNNIDAEVINYMEYFRPKLRRIRTILGGIDKFIPAFIVAKLNYRFVYFAAKHIKQSREIRNQHDLKILSKKYDTIICGSDQIWAPSVFNPVYFLDFVSDGTRKISYAASIGLPKIPDSLKSKYKKLLSDFAAISVREEEAVSLLKNIGINSTLVCDPTLLLSKEEYVDIAANINEKNDSFIFCYFLGKNPSHRNIARHISQSINKKLIIYSTFKEDTEFCEDYISHIGPSEFISYISMASMIITDSFHGMMFSVIFRKNFYVLERFLCYDPVNQNSRIYSFLRITRLNDRLLSDLPDEITHVDYSSVEYNIQKFISDSRNFLLSSI